MPEGLVLEFARLTKRFGSVHAVSDLTARVEPGAVTGFLGPNGAGKTTTLRMLLGLVRPSSGTATIGGAPYAKLKNPLQTVGAVLEASSFHPGRTGANHLKIYAQAAGLPHSRIDETLGLVGLADAAGRKVGGYSLGMRQRLGLAYALLGDPGVLVLDEPANGLDPEGIKWLRGFLQQLAREGRTVLVSSHLLTEVQQTADAVLILADGRRVFNGSISDLVDPDEQVTIVDSGDRAGLVAALRDAGIASEVLRSGVTVRSADPAEVGRAAAAAGIPLIALQRRGPALEEVFLDLVSGARVHPSADAGYDDRMSTAHAAAPAGSEPAGAERAEPAAAAAAGMAGAVGARAAADEPVITGGVVVAPTLAAAAETPDEETEFDAPPPVEGADAAMGESADESATRPAPHEPALAEATGGGAMAGAPDSSDESPSTQPETQPASEGAPEPQPESQPEPEPETALRPSFAVAGTGVIDIVATPLPPAGDAVSADEDESEDEDEDDVAEDIESAYVTHSAHAGEDERTESDLAADAFFAAFDQGDMSSEPADAGGDDTRPRDDSPERSANAEEQPEQPEQPEQSDQRDQSEQPDQPEHSPNPEEQSEVTDQESDNTAEQPEDGVGEPEDTAEPDSPPERAEHTDDAHHDEERAER